ncbi:hypothetical protein [Desulfallas thermosapovorans]|uniref:Uncharacterized protein n=1 Tax=Desulfallas thermosapovorans DSM 6562 TaxID=1121431 RepID=A0A5S4ZXR5_9FIRM|nr:hypothetical protein [Desulfallas thermosapovorans]TYO97853.1 hypothetical protein LX24_00137 [Desulfallas thermosapovorans DSM 6562]
MHAQFKPGDDVTDCVGLLISILVRYPQVASINFDPWRQILRFNFICSRVLNDNEFNEFKTLLLNSIQAYNYLEKKEAVLVEITHQVYDDLTLIEIKRDVGTLSQEEIALVVAVFYQFMGVNLVSDLNEAIIEEDLLVQEEIIEHMLESVRGSVEEKHLYAFREEGKVLVFNK